MNEITEQLNKKRAEVLEAIAIRLSSKIMNLRDWSDVG
jgi:hypothetical protein